MTGRFRGLLGDWREWRRFNALPRAARSIVFYAESRADWVHFEPIIEQLTGPLERTICYLTSEAADPVLQRHSARLLPFAIGSGTVCTALFKTIDADVMVLTLNDLDAYHLKRSARPVHYVYVCHTLASTHRIFRKGSLNAYDTILCSGPHHTREIRRSEEVYGVKAKRLIEHGYGRLDSLLRNHSQRAPFTPSAGDSKRVLIAPSWGKNSLAESCGSELVERLLAAGHHTILRPHPMTTRQHPKLIDAFVRRFGNQPLFVLETDARSEESLHTSDIMISDWSGAALEFAFGLERPVLFVDVPPKINNPEWERIGFPALEVVLRPEIGAVVAPDRLADVPAGIQRLCADLNAKTNAIRRARAAWVYNVGTSGVVGANAVLDALPPPHP